MADGMAILEINEKGEGRLKDLIWFDFRLESICFGDAEGTEQLVDQLPKETKNVLVLVVFDYVSNYSRDYWGEHDCEEFFNIVSHQLLKEDYKEFYRQMVTRKLNLSRKGYENDICIIDEDITLKDDNYCKELVSEWEEFYDEEFEPFEEEPKKINKIDDIWSTIKEI